METIILILILLVIILGYTTVNLLYKAEKSEDIIHSYREYMIQISDAISQSHDKLKEIDSKDTFSSDDEIGWFFKKVKLIQDILDQYRLRNF